MSLLDVDPERGASHRNMAEHLAGPFRDGAIETPLPITRVNDTWQARVDWVSRRPLLLVELLASRAELPLVVPITVPETQSPSATLGLASARAGFAPFTEFGSALADAASVPAPTLGLASARTGFAPFTEFGSALDDGAVAVTPPPTSTLRFAPFSEAGTVLPAWPPVPAGDAMAPFTIIIADFPDGTAADSVVGLRLIEGNLGRLLYLIGAEKARLRRQVRELHELRRLSFAFDEASPDHQNLGHALDRRGAELGVPRFADRLAWDLAARTPTSETAPEPNEAYRRRLALFRPFIQPTPRRVEQLLRDGAGAELATVTESNTEHAMAIRLVSSPDDAPRQAFLDWVRTQHLLQPGQTVPAGRLVPEEIRIEQNAALARVATAFQCPSPSLMAPLLVELLDRVGRCRTALGVTRPWHVLRAQDPTGGSRYELGLGVELELPPAGELDALAQNLSRGQLAPGTDIEVGQLLGSLTPASSAADPLGRWLLAACGAVTVHATPAGIYVSHASIFGAVLASGSQAGSFEARFEAPGDPGQNAVLWYALRDVAADAAAAGIPAWTELSASAATTARATAVVPSSAVGALIASIKLVTPATAAELARAVTALTTAPAELMTTLKLDPGLASALLAGTPAAWDKLGKLVGFFTAREVGSVLPLVTSTGSVLLVIGAQVLPGTSALVHAERLAFRWYTVPITGAPGKLSLTRGPRSTYTPAPGAPSLVALVAVSLARSDRDDPRDRIPPYAARISLPRGELIDLGTYERVMNVLERVVPVGVVLDTRRLRETNVDPAHSRQAVPLTGRLAHSFRTFQLDRRFGVASDEPAR
jgi:hypothetical protein